MLVHAPFFSPGRFFASIELKLILAYLLIKYDFKFADDSKSRPQNVHFGINVLPNPRGQIVFRKRQT